METADVFRWSNDIGTELSQRIAIAVSNILIQYALRMPMPAHY